MGFTSCSGIYGCCVASRHKISFAGAGNGWPSHYPLSISLSLSSSRPFFLSSSLSLFVFFFFATFNRQSLCQKQTVRKPNTNVSFGLTSISPPAKCQSNAANRFVELRQLRRIFNEFSIWLVNIFHRFCRKSIQTETTFAASLVRSMHVHCGKTDDWTVSKCKRHWHLNRRYQGIEQVCAFNSGVPCVRALKCSSFFVGPIYLQWPQNATRLPLNGRCLRRK